MGVKYGVLFALSLFAYWGMTAIIGMPQLFFFNAGSVMHLGFMGVIAAVCLIAPDPW